MNSIEGKPTNPLRYEFQNSTVLHTSYPTVISSMKHSLFIISQATQGLGGSDARPRSPEHLPAATPGEKRES